jgi:hypothetical protein
MWSIGSHNYLYHSEFQSNTTDHVLIGSESLDSCHVVHTSLSELRNDLDLLWRVQIIERSSSSLIH